MSRTTLNFIVDLVMVAVGLGLVTTGLTMYFVLPPGSRQLALWGLGRHDWGSIHAWLALSIVTLALVHLALHWNWVCVYVHRVAMRSPQAAAPRAGSIYGVALAVLVAALLTGFVFYARGWVEPAAGAGRHAEGRGTEATEAGPAGAAAHGGRGQATRPAINGASTLAEAAQLSGQTPAQLKQRLGLPSGTSDQTRLREVMASKGWSMAELRGRITGDTGPTH